MHSYVLYYNIEKSGFNAVSTYILFVGLATHYQFVFDINENSFR